MVLQPESDKNINVIKGNECVTDDLESRDRKQMCKLEGRVTHPSALNQGSLAVWPFLLPVINSVNEHPNSSPHLVHMW